MLLHVFAVWKCMKMMIIIQTLLPPHCLYWYFMRKLVTRKSGFSLGWIVWSISSQVIEQLRTVFELKQKLIKNGKEKKSMFLNRISCS